MDRCATISAGGRERKEKTDLHHIEVKLVRRIVGSKGCGMVVHGGERE